MPAGHSYHRAPLAPPAPRAMRAPGATLLAVAAAAAAAVSAISCGHSEPYAPGDAPPNPPVFLDGAQRLTFNPEGDWAPAFLPDGSAFGYSYHEPERRDRDRCLALIPAAGGRITRLVCRRGGTDSDTANVIASHAVSPGGRLAFIYQSGGRQFLAPASRQLLVASLARPESATVVVAFPYLAPTGVTHFTATNLSWKDERTLVYLAEHVQYLPGAPGIPPDTNSVGLEIVVLDLSGPVPARTVVPGTPGATSVAIDPADGLAYATFALDSSVYRIDLASGQRERVVHFGNLGVARGLQVRGGRLVAVVGGRVQPAPAVLFGVDTQYDEGGLLATAELPLGMPQLLRVPQGFLFLHPTLAPARDRVIAEAFALATAVDTVVARASDLFAMPVP